MRKLFVLILMILIHNFNGYGQSDVSKMMSYYYSTNKPYEYVKIFNDKDTLFYLIMKDNKRYDTMINPNFRHFIFEKLGNYRIDTRIENGQKTVSHYNHKYQLTQVIHSSKDYWYCKDLEQGKAMIESMEKTSGSIAVTYFDSHPNNIKHTYQTDSTYYVELIDTIGNADYSIRRKTDHEGRVLYERISHLKGSYVYEIDCENNSMYYFYKPNNQFLYSETRIAGSKNYEYQNKDEYIKSTRFDDGHFKYMKHTDFGKVEYHGKDSIAFRETRYYFNKGNTKSYLNKVIELYNTENSDYSRIVKIYREPSREKPDITKFYKNSKKLKTVKYVYNDYSELKKKISIEDGNRVVDKVRTSEDFQDSATANLSNEPIHKLKPKLGLRHHHNFYKVRNLIVHLSIKPSHYYENLIYVSKGDSCMSFSEINDLFQAKVLATEISLVTDSSSRLIPHNMSDDWINDSENSWFSFFIGAELRYGKGYKVITKKWEDKTETMIKLGDESVRGEIRFL